MRFLVLHGVARRCLPTTLSPASYGCSPASPYPRSQTLPEVVWAIGHRELDGFGVGWTWRCTGFNSDFWSRGNQQTVTWLSLIATSAAGILLICIPLQTVWLLLFGSFPCYTLSSPLSKFLWPKKDKITLFGEHESGAGRVSLANAYE